MSRKCLKSIRKWCSDQGAREIQKIQTEMLGDIQILLNEVYQQNQDIRVRLDDVEDQLDDFEETFDSFEETLDSIEENTDDEEEEGMANAD